MAQFELVEIITGDTLVHQGIYTAPAKPGKRALLWVHGLTGRFYGNVTMMNTLADACISKGWGFASFNNRGHDMVTGFHKRSASGKDEYLTAGAGLENFSECIYDVDAGISHLAAKGFREVVLLGHSTGANKVCYYMATVNDSRVFGIVLAGPMSDRLSARTDRENYQSNIESAKNLVIAGKGGEIQIGKHFMPLTPKRYLSLMEKGSLEDVFNYGDENNQLSVFGKITKPTLVVLSGNDEIADRPMEDIKKVFDIHTSSPHYKSVIIPHANHSYDGKEEEFVSTVLDWINRL